MLKVIDWKIESERAEMKSDSELEYAIKDAQKCVQLRCNDGFYCDQISVYRTEQRKRGLVATI